MNDPAVAPSALEGRLLRFLDHEEADEQRTHEELRALAIDERVLEGECIVDARLESIDADGFRFHVEENASKFREGDALSVGDGRNFDASMPLVYARYVADEAALWLGRDRFLRHVPVGLEVGAHYVIDRRPLGLGNRLHDVVRAGFADPAIAAVLEGEHRCCRDEARHERAVAALTAAGLHPTQVAAGAAAIATESVALVQGPPGTGKTRLLAEMLRVLCSAGCRIVLSAFTHRAIDNVLFALRRLDRDLPIVKVGNAGGNAAALADSAIRSVSVRQFEPPRSGIVAGTSFAFARLTVDLPCHYAVFDEAGQIPIPHAIAGMLRSRRWLFFGDHRQLPPVVTAQHADTTACRSVFEHLHERFGSALLDTSWRMNDGICDVVGRHFYDGRLRSEPNAAARRMPFVAGGALDEVLDPQRPVVVAQVDHLQPGSRSLEEAELCAALIVELLRRHRLPPAEIAVIAPFRAQVRLVRSALQRCGIRDEALLVDTVERAQGQEREVVIVSLAVGDPATLGGRSSFFFSTNRLNVALSRARSKAILVASSTVFRALPLDPDGLRATSTFVALWRELPRVDLTSVFGAR